MKYPSSLIPYITGAFEVFNRIYFIMTIKDFCKKRF